MGKGYNNFMSKKAFHPGSYANQKRVHEAEERAEAKRKHDEETLQQYLKEQELFNQKSMVSKESKEKLSLNFMYDAPPGFKKPESKPGDKVEWKGVGNSNSSKNSSTNSSSGCNEPKIQLEWKRERPVKKDFEKGATKQDMKDTGGIIPKVEIKKEIKSEIANEKKVEFSWKREVTKKRDGEILTQELKRTKKER